MNAAGAGAYGGASGRSGRPLDRVAQPNERAGRRTESVVTWPPLDSIGGEGSRVIVPVRQRASSSPICSVPQDRRGRLEMLAVAGSRHALFPGPSALPDHRTIWLREDRQTRSRPCRRVSRPWAFLAPTHGRQSGPNSWPTEYRVCPDCSRARRDAAQRIVSDLAEAARSIRLLGLEPARPTVRHHRCHSGGKSGRRRGESPRGRALGAVPIVPDRDQMQRRLIERVDKRKRLSALPSRAGGSIMSPCCLFSQGRAHTANAAFWHLSFNTSGGNTRVSTRPHALGHALRLKGHACSCQVKDP